MATQTKKLNACSETTAVNSGEKFPKVDSNGAITLISAASLRSEMTSGIDPRCALSGMFIAYHDNGSARMVAPDKWPGLQAAGQTADGVAIVEGGHILIVAPTGATGMNFSSAVPTADTSFSSSADLTTILTAFDGKARTAAIIAASTASAVTNTAAYAPGFCHLYSRGGIGAGQWWLPSLGELMMINSNRHRINHCLSLISGSQALPEGGFYMSSVENTGNFVGVLSDYTQLAWAQKSDGPCAVRPVSTFII